MDCSPPGSSVHGIFQARILEWVTFTSLEDLPEVDPGIQPTSPPLAGGFFTTEQPGTPAAAAKSVMSDSVQPHRRHSTRLPGPWDSPGKNTGVGCHFLLQCMKVKMKSEVAQSCPTLSDLMD